MTNLQILILILISYLIIGFFIGKYHDDIETNGDLISFMLVSLIPLMGQVVFGIFAFATIQQQYKKWDSSKYFIFRRFKSFWNKPLNK